MSAPRQQLPPSELQRAGLVSRFAAFFLDAIILSVTLRSVAWLLRGADRMLSDFAPPVNFSALIFAWAPLLVSLYLVVSWTMSGQTPGKWLFGLKVVPFGGGKMTFQRSVLRLVGYIISALPVYLGFVSIAGAKRLGWHDRLARTEVTYVRRRSRPHSPTAMELRARMGAGLTPGRPVAFHRGGPLRASKAGARP